MRRVLAAVVILGSFASILAFAPKVMPGPMTRTEQMVVGTLATLIALLAAYLFVMLGWFKAGEDKPN